MDDLEEQSDVEEAEERGEERGGKAGQPVRKLLAMRGEPNLKHKDGSFNDIRRDGHVLDLCPRSIYLPVYLCPCQTLTVLCEGKVSSLFENM